MTHPRCALAGVQCGSSSVTLPGVAFKVNISTISSTIIFVIDDQEVSVRKKSRMLRSFKTC